METHIITLPDGRALAYAAFGPAHGEPVLYFHGTPSSRLEPLMCSLFGLELQNLLEQFAIRLIAVDRPGMGLSAFHVKGGFLTFAGDAAQLLQHLAIRQCKILCWSGGGPYALAMAYQYPSIVTALFIVAGFATPFKGPVVNKCMRTGCILRPPERCPGC